MSGFRMITRFFHQTFNACGYGQKLFYPFVDQLTKDEKLTDGYFQQEAVTEHTALTTLSGVHEVYGEERTNSNLQVTSIV